MVRINEVEIKKQSWRRQDVEVPRRTGTSENGMEVIINREDGYVNGTKLSDQIGIRLYGFFKLDDPKESVEHIKMLTGDKEKYQGESPWDNVKGVYLHPFLALEMVAIKKNEDSDYEEYYEFLKETIFEFLDNNIELKNRYFFIVDIFDIHVNIDTSDILSSEEFHG